MLFDRHPEYRPKWGDRHFWARGYYVTTVGNVNEETIRNYIREQKENDKLEDRAKVDSRQGWQQVYSALRIPPLAEQVLGSGAANDKSPFEMGVGNFESL